MVELKIFIYYASWLTFPLLVWAISKKYLIVSLLSLLFIYARFIEPQLLLVHHYKINTGFQAKYALIGDLHLGIYNDASILQKAVEKIEQLDVDALLIAGDFIYEPNPNKLKNLFAPLQNLSIPIYAVLGNHDCIGSGASIRKELEAVLAELGVILLTNKAIELHSVTLLGLGSRFAHEDRVALLDNYSKEDNLVVLTHNPDTALDFQPNHTPDLTLTGHTHGGQIRIPYLYKKVIPIEGVVPWDKGLSHYKNGQVFITSGIGSIGLPLRFLIPPTIDVLTLH